MPSLATSQSGATSPLVSRFFEFWEEVEELRRQVRLHRPADHASLVARGRARLAEALRKQRPAAARSHAAPQTPLEAVQYVMAATADEQFIALDWQGAPAWTLRPLEMELFGSRRAGEEVFARIDELLTGAVPGSTDMAAVYLTALELGFTGKFADADDRQTLDRYEFRLRELVGRQPSAIGPIVPDCYGYTIVAGSGRQLPASQRWWWAAVGTVAIFLIALVIMLAQFRGSPVEDARQRLETSFGLVAGSK